MTVNNYSILDIIGGRGKCFVIPPFQRNYEWGEEQCWELFCDIVELQKVNTKKPGATHYMGNIVYYVSNKTSTAGPEYVLIDGQQRMTTILLLLCAIRSLTKDENIKQSITNDFLRCNSNGSFRIRLKQTSYDNDNFIAVINGEADKNKKDPIEHNYFLFCEWILNKNIDIPSFFYALNGLSTIDVNLDIAGDLRAVQTIFEKINSTGKPLSASDLIRNYLLIVDNVSEQTRLYNSYWIKVEQLVKNENITSFIRDYLIMKTFDDVPIGNLYRAFKEYAAESALSHEDILKDLYECAKYYQFLLSANSSDARLNRVIEMLKYLGIKDIAPLALFVLRRLYDSSEKDSLIKIFTLLKDFLLRFRVVLRSSGSLCDSVHNVLKEVAKVDILFYYDTIYYELSNSYTDGGRWPLDEEFSNALMENRTVNRQCAKVILLSIEEHETKNIPVPFKDVTIEHIMPRTLNDEWRKSLGGQEKSEEVYSKYLDCIGNLALLSQSYNSKNSNEPWDKKRENFKDVQFKVTSELYQNKNWGESQLKKRNKNIAARACDAIIAPQKRQRAQRGKNEAVSGTYSAKDTQTKMDGAKIVAFYNKNERVGVSTWKEYFNDVCRIAFEKDKVRFGQLVDNNTFHKTSSKHSKSGKDPLITKEKGKLRDAKEIVGTDYYNEGCLSSAYIRKYAYDILDKFGLLDDFKIEIVVSNDKIDNLLWEGNDDK